MGWWTLRIQRINPLLGFVIVTAIILLLVLLTPVRYAPSNEEHARNIQAAYEYCTEKLHLKLPPDPSTTPVPVMAAHNQCFETALSILDHRDVLGRNASAPDGNAKR